jgi:signal transduction histidine kinase
MDEIQIEVHDNGIGIPRADQDRIFQKLFRAHNARETEVNGSGLGLYSSKKIIETLGGTIRFESEENKGTTFIVTFPIQGGHDEMQ